MFTLNLKGRIWSSEKPVVMGILNLTDDSFHPDSRFPNVQEAVQRGVEMLEAGADWVDLGAQSTRPGSIRVDPQAELTKLIPVIQGILCASPNAIVSVDTYHASVANASVQAGALMVNDVSGGMMDPAMLETVGKLHVPYICTHMQGTPETMQLDPQYENVVADLMSFFAGRIQACLASGIHDIILDPGFGFGKNLMQNYELLGSISVFKEFRLPLMVGLSRKSMIQRVLGVKASQALNGTTVLHTVALLNGVDIIRVHDVKEAIEAIQLISMLPSKA